MPVKKEKERVKDKRSPVMERPKSTDKNEGYIYLCNIYLSICLLHRNVEFQ